MSGFGSFLREKRRQKLLTLQDLSELSRKFWKETGWCPDASQLSRWETGKAVPLPKHRPALLAIAKILGMDDSDKNEFLIKAGLSPLQGEELDVDAMLSKLGSEGGEKLTSCANA